MAPTPDEIARLKDVMRLFRNVGEDTSRFGGGRPFRRPVQARPHGEVRHKHRQL